MNKLYSTYLKLLNAVGDDRNKTKMRAKIDIFYQNIIMQWLDSDDDQGDVGVLLLISMMFDKQQGLKYLKAKQSQIIENYLAAKFNQKTSKNNKNLDIVQKIEQKFVDLVNKFNEKSDAVQKVFLPNQFYNLPSNAHWHIIRHFEHILEFDVYKSFNKDYTCPNVDTQDVGRFQELSQNELLNFFSPSKFYALSTTEKHNLFQAVVNDYCNLRGVKSCLVSLSDLPLSSTNVCFGEFVPTESTILLNSAVFDAIDDCKKTKNAFLPYQILLTLVHEAQHRVQFEKIDEPVTSQKQQLINKCLLEPQLNLSQKAYISSFDELDARNCALEYIKNAIDKTDNLTLEKFYNTKLLDEQKQAKEYLTAQQKNMFDYIFNQKPTSSRENLNVEKNQFYRILHSKQEQLSM